MLIPVSQQTMTAGQILNKPSILAQKDFSAPVNNQKDPASADTDSTLEVRIRWAARKTIHSFESRKMLFLQQQSSSKKSFSSSSCDAMVFSCGESVVSEAQMSLKKQRAKTKAQLRNLLSSVAPPLSSFSCFVSACPSSSNNQRPEPSLHSLSASQGVLLHSLQSRLSPFLPFLFSFGWPGQE